MVFSIVLFLILTGFLAHPSTFLAFCIAYALISVPTVSCTCRPPRTNKTGWFKVNSRRMRNKKVNCAAVSEPKIEPTESQVDNNVHGTANACIFVAQWMAYLPAHTTWSFSLCFGSIERLSSFASTTLANIRAGAVIWPNSSSVRHNFRFHISLPARFMKLMDLITCAPWVRRFHVYLCKSSRTCANRTAKCVLKKNHPSKVVGISVCGARGKIFCNIFSSLHAQSGQLHQINTQTHTQSRAGWISEITGARGVHHRKYWSNKPSFCAGLLFVTIRMFCLAIELDRPQFFPIGFILPFTRPGIRLFRLLICGVFTNKAHIVARIGKWNCIILTINKLPSNCCLFRGNCAKIRWRMATKLESVPVFGSCYMSTIFQKTVLSTLYARMLARYECEKCYLFASHTHNRTPIKQQNVPNNKMYRKNGRRICDNKPSPNRIYRQECTTQSAPMRNIRKWATSGVCPYATCLSTLWHTLTMSADPNQTWAHCNYIADNENEKSRELSISRERVS